MYILLNFSFQGGKIIENEIDNALKEVPFNAKFSVKGSQLSKFDYNYVLLKVKNEDLTDQDYLVAKNEISRKCQNISNDNIIYTIYLIVKEILQFNINYTITLIKILADNDFNILYTDGSFKKKTNEASYACCQLLNENGNLEDALFDDFTEKNYSYLSYAGTIQEGTNNIGELTGIKIASQHFGNKLFQIIISDSEYSIKTFREWYYTWKDNNFKNYARKEIANCELIKETFNELFSKDKVVLFKWTKGHDNNSFNEKCDKLAKGALGIK